MRRIVDLTTVAIALAVALVGAVVLAAGSARAAEPTFPAYGQVASVGGFDSSATYLPIGGASDGTRNASTGYASTVFHPTQHPNEVGEFVYPLGMAVSADASGATSLYVLDNIDPQENNAQAPADQILSYRIQRIAIVGGVEQVIGSTTFSLDSSKNYKGQATTHDQGQHAVALAVDPTNSRVDVLIDDVPTPDPDDQIPAAGNDAYEVLEWPSSLSGSATTVVSPTTLQPKNADSSKGTIKGDIDGESLAWAGTGASAQLAIGGNQYLNASSSYSDGGGAGSGSGTVQPAIEKLSLSPPNGAISATWTDWRSAVNSTASDFYTFSTDWVNDPSHPQPLLYGMSRNADGSLNVTIGPSAFFTAGLVPQSADLEPIMATVAADLGGRAQPLLPDPLAVQAAQHQPGGVPISNPELSAAGVVNGDDSPSESSNPFNFLSPISNGGTPQSGTLGPSVIQLAGDGTSFPKNLYAGLVYGGSDYDNVLDATGNALTKPPWQLEPTDTLAAASVGIRIFDPTTGSSLGIIGNQSGGVCAIEGGSNSLNSSLTGGGIIALAPGANGALYALMQPDLYSQNAGSIDPGSPEVTSGTNGDRILEFAPGSGTPCPVPEGSFGVTNASVSGGTEDTSLDPISVSTGTTLSFDAGAYNLQGDVPRSYSWDLDNGAGDGKSNAGFTFHNVDNSPAWYRPNPTATFRYTTPGTYTAKLTVVSDFGTTTVSRTINVHAPGQVSAAFSPPASLTATQPARFDASGSSGGGDQIVDYHWDFGDGNSDDQPSPFESWAYSGPGTYTVTLTVSNANGTTATTSHQVTVGPAPPPPTPPYTPPTQTTSTTGTTPTSTGQPKARIDRKPTSVSPKAQSANLAKAVLVSVSCPKSKTACVGTVTLQTAKPVRVTKHGKPKTLTLGRGKFSLTAGGKRFIEIALSKQGRSLIKPGKSMTIKVIVAAHDAYGDPRTTTLKLTLHKPPKIKVFG